MLFYPTERTALFIDGTNLYSAAKQLQFDIDYKKLLTLFATKSQLIRAYYYTAILDESEFSPLKPLVDWLDYNGYSVVTKAAKQFTDSVTGKVRTKGNMDIELAVDMMGMALNASIDHLILFSGDGDFRYVIEAIQRLGKRVTVVSTLKTSPPMVADELRRQADNFIEFDELKHQITRLKPPILKPRIAND